MEREFIENKPRIQGASEVNSQEATPVSAIEDERTASPSTLIEIRAETAKGWME